MMGLTFADVLWAGTTLLAYLAWQEARWSRKERAESVRILAEHVTAIATAHAASLHQAIRDESTAQFNNLSAHVNVVTQGHAGELHRLLNEQLGAIQNTLEQRLPPASPIAIAEGFDRRPLPAPRRSRAAATKA